VSSGPARTRPIERRTVSRKTPGDGKLEITKVAATQLASLGERFAVAVESREGQAALGTMPCTCRGDDAPHVHYFIESELLRALPVGCQVDLLIDDTTTRLIVVIASS
jgi:hypothetical protein